MKKNDDTYFGFKQVSEQEKKKLVGSVFSNVAPKYDIMNDLMSFGLHRLWKDHMVSELALSPKKTLLDVAGGTGDIAKRVIKKCPEMHITICDINKDMLQVGRAKSIDDNQFRNISWNCGDAENLPFPDNSFDYYTIGFGIRNVSNIDKALQEAYRVLKVGGRFLCLEFSKIQKFNKLYDIFSFNIIPKMGKIVAHDEESYRYLVESIRKFPAQDDFLKMIENAGFARAKYTNMTFGAVALHSGWKVK